MIDIIKQYSSKYEKKIKTICDPLSTYLNIDYFSYYFIEDNGRFGTLSNLPSFFEYYYHNKLYLTNPYMSHPKFFRSGYTLIPCTFDMELQRTIEQKFEIEDFFLRIKRSPGKTEGFIYFNKQLQKPDHFMDKLHLLDKFGSYFKREASSLIGKMSADQFNIKQEREESFLSLDSTIPLSNNNKETQEFLKIITGLSPQEHQCLELFQNGYSAQATASILNISRRTVEHYFDNVKSKLKCRSKWDLLTE